MMQQVEAAAQAELARLQGKKAEVEAAAAAQMHQVSTRA